MRPLRCPSVIFLATATLATSATSQQTGPRAATPYVPGATWERRDPAAAGFDPARLTAAIRFAIQSDANPLIAHETQPTKTVAELARADDRLARELTLITLPVLILHGTADKATKPSGSQQFFDAAASQDKTLQLYEGHYHDLLNDTGKEMVLADMFEWAMVRART